LPLISSPFVDVELGDFVAQTKTTGINIGGKAAWGSSVRSNERLGEVFYLYVKDKNNDIVDLDIWTSSLTGEPECIRKIYYR